MNPIKEAQTNSQLLISERANKKLIVMGFIKYVDYLLNRFNKELPMKQTGSLMARSIMQDEKTILIEKLKSI